MEVREPRGRYLGAQQVRATDLGILPADWVVASISELGVTASGTTPSRGQQDRYYSRGRFAWVKTLDLNNGEIFATDESVTELALSETSLRIFPPGSVLVAMYGGLRQIGRTGLLRVPAAVNQAITAIQPDRTQLVPGYLLATLNYRVDYWKCVASSSRKDPNITGADVRAFKLAKPRLEEQHAIAEALTDADALIDSLEQLLTKKRQIKQGAMQELLTGKRRLPGFSGAWSEHAFGDLAEPSRERAVPANMAVVPLCVELEHIQAGAGRLVSEAFESRQVAQKTIFSKGDVLFGKLRAYLRKYLLADFAGVCSTEIWSLRSRGILQSNAYLFCIVKRDDFIEAASSAYGTHMPRSDWNVVRAFRVRLPEAPAEQQAIAQVLTDIDTAITALEARLNKARQLKQAMMQVLLTGRIRLVAPAAAPDCGAAGAATMLKSG